MDTSTRKKEVKVPFVRGRITTDQYLTLLGELTEEGVKGRIEVLDYFNDVKKVLDKARGSIPNRRQWLYDTTNLLGRELYDFEIQVMTKILFIHQTMILLYEDLISRLEKYPTRRQVRRTYQLQKISFAKSLLKQMKYKPPKTKMALKPPYPV